ncbi:MAG: hypothetical protein JF612_06030, partial [Planctomycetia bacterium]|nr:hypothetical protein [Planctomycetia bacterium]
MPGFYVTNSGQHVTGNSVTNSSFSNIATANIGFEHGFAIAAFQSDTTITDVDISHSGAGIASNYFVTDADAPQLTISGVHIHDMQTVSSNPIVGLDLSGLANGSSITGSLAHPNVIDMTGGSNHDLALVIQYAASGAGVTFSSNTITTGAGDTGLYLYQDADSAHPVLVQNNIITGSGSATGILATDDGAVFGEGPHAGTTYAMLAGNTISGYSTGIAAASDASGPGLVNVTVGGAGVGVSNSITGTGHAGTGISISGPHSIATIQGNTGSIHGFAIGVDVNGGSASVSNNHVYDNGTGVRFTATGSGTVDSNDFEGAANPDNGTDLRLDSTAGQVGGVTHTLSGNTFAGTTYIDNRSPQNLTALATANTYKRDNANVETDNFAIENRVYHKIDNAASGLVTWDAGDIYVTPAATPTATDNDYTRLANALAAATDGVTIHLQGTFDWTEANAAASWAKGNDGLMGTTATDNDNYELEVPAGLDGVTLTAASLGAATIKGPGDLPAVNLEGVLVFDQGPNINWTVSNLVLNNFDLGIGFFASGSHDFDGTHVTNNHIIVANDLNSVAASADVNQNIGIHYSFGK